ncbi:phage major capsid protein [Streptomyces sp. NPDC003860]
MAKTTSATMIVPEVWGDMAQGEFLGKVRVAGSAAVIEDNTLEGAPGSTIEFPKWGSLGELDELSETTPLVPVPMATSSARAVIKEAGKAVEITDKAKLVSLGDPEAEARRQFGKLAARKVDADLITQAQADETALGGGNPLRFTTATGKTKFTWLDAMVPAIAQFGDEWEPGDFAGLFLNSAQYTDALSDSRFIDAEKLGSGPSAAVTGSIGRIGGVPVFLTNRVAAGTFLLMKNGALGLLYKRRPLVEDDRDILGRCTVVTTTMHYAVKRLADRGVVIGTLATT